MGKTILNEELTDPMDIAKDIINKTLDVAIKLAQDKIEPLGVSSFEDGYNGACVDLIEGLEKLKR